MKFKEIMEEAINNNWLSVEHKGFILYLVGDIDIEDIDEELIEEYYEKIYYCKKKLECVSPSNKLMDLINYYKSNNIELSNVFKCSKNLMNAIVNGNRIRIENAKIFCLRNDFDYSEYFIKNYRKASYVEKETIKNCIVSVFNYAISRGYISKNVARCYYIFDDNYYNDSYYFLPYDNHQVRFLQYLEKYKNKKRFFMFYFLFHSYFDLDIVNHLKKRNIDFEHKKIKFLDIEITLTKKRLKILKSCCSSMSDDDYIFRKNEHLMTSLEIEEYLFSSEKKDIFNFKYIKNHYEYLYI